MSNTLTVSQLNFYIKSLIDSSEPLKNIYIVGEISNFKYYARSGHMYFTLKDDKSQLKAVMFSSYAQRLKFNPEDGMNVVCRGNVSVYDRDGVYQLYVSDMQPDGYGALYIAFEQLKQQLEKEGLFSPEHKKPIPKYPAKIGVATSNTGAAVEDIKNIIQRRYPLCEIIISPTIVQGDQAPADIVHSIKTLDNMGDIDVIIVGRGGGSIEDLWAFNTQQVARAVYECKTPIISAVGHETDFTICDFVADLRAPTPSAAAELAVPDINELKSFLSNAKKRLSLLLIHRLESEYQRFDSIVYDSVLSDPIKYYKSFYDDIKSLNLDLSKAFEHCVKTSRLRLGQLAGRLDALSPLAVLGRGYGVIKGQDECVIKSVGQIKTDDKVEIVLRDGSAVCTVNEVKEYEQ